MFSKAARKQSDGGARSQKHRRVSALKRDIKSRAERMADSDPQWAARFRAIDPTFNTIFCVCCGNVVDADLKLTKEERAKARNCAVCNAATRQSRVKADERSCRTCGEKCTRREWEKHEKSQPTGVKHFGKRSSCIPCKEANLTRHRTWQKNHTALMAELRQHVCEVVIAEIGDLPPHVIRQLREHFSLT